MNNSETAQKIKEAEEHLASLQQQLEARKFPTIQESKVGDVLEDGSIVLIKESNHAIVVCSKDREFTSTWNDLEKNKTANGFGPEWFIPSKELLYLAYKKIPQHFSRDWYWSSTENNAANACFANFSNGNQSYNYKRNTSCVRSVRCIVF